MTDTSAEPGYENTKALILSPSQYSNWTLCQRSWAWRYLLHIKTPDKASAAKGTRVHKQTELYLTGQPFDASTPAMREAMEIAIPGFVNLPPPLSPGMLVEASFSFEAKNGIVWRGLKDVSVPDSIVIPKCKGGVPGFIDHKSTKHRKYMKTEEQLRSDPQAVTYAYDTMAYYKVPTVDVVYNYLLTEGARATERVHLRMHQDRVVEEFQKMNEVGNRIAVTYAARPHPLELTPSTSACSAFGGCPYVGLCTDLHSGPLGHLTPEEEATTMNPIDLFATVPAAPAVQPLPAGITNAPPGYTPAPFLVAAKPLSIAEQIAAIKVVPPAINPPEFQPPPTVEQRAAEAAQAPVAEKTRKPRATKAEMEARKAAVAAGAEGPLTGRGFTPECAPTGTPPERIVDVSVDTRGFTLFIDCAPVGEDYTYASDIFAKAKEHVHHELKVADYRFADYGKGQGAFVVAACHYLDTTFTGDVLVLDSGTPEGMLVLSDFTSRAAHVVRSFK